MLLQAAIDDPGHIDRLHEIAEFVDIVEVGTPVLKQCGVAAIRAVREICPDHSVLVDTKTVDGGALEAEIAYGAGGSIITILSRASPETVEKVASVAQKHGGSFFLDTICEVADLQHWIEAASIHPLCACVNLHSPTDAGVNRALDGQIATAIASLRKQGKKVAVAGRMGPDRIDTIRDWAPDIVVVGGAIFNAANPAEAAARMKGLL